MQTDNAAEIGTTVEACPICFQTHANVYLDDKTDVITSTAVGASRTHVSPGRILRCQNCGFGFRQLRPSPDYLARLYRVVDSQVYESEQSGRARAARGHLRLIQRFVPEAGWILDIGCAFGLFLRCAQDAGWKVTGIEPNESLARSAAAVLGKEGVVHNATLENAALSRDSFDVITMWDLLEHVPDPVSFLRRAASLLKPGGLLFAKVPNLDSVQARVLRTRWPLLLPEHLNYFNAENLQACGTKAGLRWIGSRQHTVAFSVGYILYRLQQHGVPGAGLAYNVCGKVGLRNLVIPITAGEICGIWKR